MEKKELKMELPKITLDDLFTTQSERDDSKLEKVINIKINEIDDFPYHPFKVQEDEDMQKMCDSIKDNGVLVPAIVRKKKDGRYEMVSGHRRKFASSLIGLEEIPCIVKDLTNDEATIIMVDSNLQREKILPSEKAFAYQMKLEAIKNQRNNLSVSPVGTRINSGKDLEKEVEDSRTQIYRYIRLTELIPELLDLVDEEKIALRPAVELSYLDDDEQYEVLDCIQYMDCTPSLEQAYKMRRLSEKKELTANCIEETLKQQKPNQTPRLPLNESRLRDVLPKNLQDKQIEEFIIKAIEYYTRHLKQKEMNSR